MSERDSQDSGAYRQERAHLFDGMGGRERAAGGSRQGSVGEAQVRVEKLAAEEFSQITP